MIPRDGEPDRQREYFHYVTAATYQGATRYGRKNNRGASERARSGVAAGARSVILRMELIAGTTAPRNRRTVRLQRP